MKKFNEKEGKVFFFKPLFIYKYNKNKYKKKKNLKKIKKKKKNSI